MAFKNFTDTIGPKGRRAALLALLSFAVSGNAGAQVVTQCGASQGYGYFFPGPIVPRSETGWQRDSISKGSIQLVLDGSNVDIIMGDARGSRSMKADGFDIFTVRQKTSGFFAILAVHPKTGVIEHYLFKLDEIGNGEVVWGSVNAGAGLTEKSILLRAECKQMR